MLDILRLPMTKETLSKMTPEERSLFLLLGYASNQVNALWKLVIIATNQLENGGADCRHVAAGDGADQNGRHGPDGEGAGCGVGLAWADRDAGGGICGHRSGRAIRFKLGDGGIDWPNCDRRRPDAARLALCVCDDGVNRLLCGLRDAGVVAGEHAGDGAWRLRLRRLHEGRSAAAVADIAGYGRTGGSDLSCLGISVLAQQKWWEQHVKEPTSAPSHGASFCSLELKQFQTISPGASAFKRASGPRNHGHRY